MGVITTLPLFAMDAAALKGAPRRPQLPDFLETVHAPPSTARALIRGDLIKISFVFHNVCGSGVNSSFMCVSPDQKRTKKFPASARAAGRSGSSQTCAGTGTLRCISCCQGSQGAFAAPGLTVEPPCIFGFTRSSSPGFKKKSVVLSYRFFISISDNKPITDSAAITGKGESGVTVVGETRGVRAALMTTFCPGLITPDAVYGV